MCCRWMQAKENIISFRVDKIWQANKRILQDIYKDLLHRIIIRHEELREVFGLCRVFVEMMF